VPDIDSIYTDATAPGLSDQHAFRTAGASLTLDFRNEPDLPSSGTFVGLGIWHAWRPGVEATASSWSRLVTDVRQFVSAPTPKQVLAFRLLVSTPLGSARATPFYFQPTLGGSKTLRGFGSYRLRGDAVWAGTAEYRLQVHKWIQVAPFVDVGAVADRWSTLTDTRSAATPGVGIRATSDGRVIGRVDFAKGRDGSRAVLTLSTPF
jgi:outer membrane protein assembly factor BamA